MSGALRCGVVDWLRRDARLRAARLAASAVSAVRRDGGLDPTPETKRKLQRSAIDVLRDKRLRGCEGAWCLAEHADAAAEIAAVYLALTAGLWVRVMPLGERVPGGSSADWSARFADRVARYRRWAEQPAVVRSVGRERTSVHGVVVSAAVDGLGLRQIADRYGMDQRTVEAALRDGLDLYAVLAGWLTESARAA